MTAHLFRCLILGAAISPVAAAERTPPHHAPAPPVSIIVAPPGSSMPMAPAGGDLEMVSVQAEWVWHKSADGTRPSGPEQQLVWLMNRARTLPGGEGRWLAGLTEAESAIRYFGVDTSLLCDEFDQLAAAAPAAFDRRLQQAAQAHSEDLIQRDAQDHNGQFERVREAGFQYQSGRGSVFSYSRSALYAHAGFNIDWGNGPGGMQDGRGHRVGLMAADRPYSSVGIAFVAAEDAGKQVGPFVTTINYMSARAGATDHANRFLVGTAWNDLDGNGRYDSGEGLDGVEVRPESGGWYAVTGRAGGYALPVDAGTVTVTFSGGSLPAPVSRTIRVEDRSRRLDLCLHQEPARQAPRTLLRLSPTGGSASWEGEPGRLYQLLRRTTEGGWSGDGLPAFYGAGASLSADLGPIPTEAGQAALFQLQVLD